MKRVNLNSIVISVILTALLIAGRATTQRPATPFDKPEVIKNTSYREKIKSVIINEFMNSGFTMISESDYPAIHESGVKKYIDWQLPAYGRFYIWTVKM